MDRELRILIADDAAVMRHLLSHWLNKMTCCRVTQVADGIEALQAYKAACDREEPFDLIFTDMKMSHDSVVRVIESIRQEFGDRTTPLIVLTTFAGSELRERAIKAGATGYLTKPLRYYELLRTMMKLYGVAKGEAEGEPATAR